ncbi:collagen-binding protein [Bacteroidia bacterium]|nr:collagen-binding protein [Bacteroidia bacterium]
MSVFGQENSTLAGILLDKASDEPIIAGSITLLQSKDSTLVTGAISDVDGRFSFKDVQAGSYILKITYLGYIPLTKNVTVKAGQTSVNAGKLYLETDAILLSETVVEGKKPEVIVKNDTIEYDASSYKVQENAVVEDLLKKMPGVEVATDGKITVNGKEVKKFLVNNKEFFSDDPQIASKNLPAEMVDKLQVVDRKSDMARMTGFDDGEEETIINLTVKQGMMKGTMGNALVGAGTNLNGDEGLRRQAAGFLSNRTNNDSYTLILGNNNNNNQGAGDLGANQFSGMRMGRGSGGIAETTNFMLSMNKEFSSKLNLNGDVRYQALNRESQSDVYQTNSLIDYVQLDRTKTNGNYLSDSFSANFNLEWKPDTMNTLILRPNIRYNNSHSNASESSSVANAYTNPSDTVRNYDSKSDTYNKGDGISFGGSLDFAHKFAKRGRVFSINLRGNYNDSYSLENSDWLKRQYDANDALGYHDVPQIRRSENDNNTNTYRATLSYVEPIGHNNFLQALYRISHNDIQSINSTYDLINSGTALLIDSVSRSTLRNTLDQRIGLSFKAVRAKYNYTVGFNVDPTRSRNETYQPDPDKIFPVAYDENRRLENLIGDSLVSSIPQDVINFSPVVNFNYIFGQRTNLRIDYEGETNQPSASQLDESLNTSRPTEWSKGNSHLKPGYENQLRMRFQKYVPETQLMYNIDLSGNFSLNDIASTTQMQGDTIRITSYDNINGNWNTQLRGMFNLPLRNKRFTIGNAAFINYRNQNSYVSQGSKEENRLKNTMKNFSVMENVNINYRSDLFDIGLNANINYNSITHTVNKRDEQNTYGFGTGAYTTWYLPYNWTLQTDINLTARRGYDEKEYNTSEVMWNAAISKQLFNKKFGTGSLKLQIYDILQDRNDISTTYTNTGFRTSQSLTIPSYFMCSFIYKFSAFPKSSSATENDMRPGGRQRGMGGSRPQGPPPGGFGGGFRPM